MVKILELKNVSKTMGKKKIVDNISFHINEGEIFGFLGPNGAGKTTTIKMITGLLSIDEGEIFIDGKNVKKDFENALSEVGGIIENPEMYGYLTGRENLEIYAGMHGKITKERLEETISMVKLENRIDDKVKKYSLGMRQRLGLAQALLHRPKLLILDEPTNGLDPVGIKELRDNLRELAEKEGLAVLVSSHLLSEMELMCDRFGIIDNGKIIDTKTIQDIHGSKAQDENTYEVDVDNVNKSMAIIKENFKAGNFNGKIISSEDNIIKINTSKKEMAGINKCLVNSGIMVYTITPIANTLEDEFIKITNGSKGQIR